MIRRVDLRGARHSKAEVQDLLPRATLDVNEAMKLIEPILTRVKEGRIEDLYALGQEFDGVRPPSLRVPQAALDAALAELDPEIRRSLDISIERIHDSVVEISIVILSTLIILQAVSNGNSGKSYSPRILVFLGDLSYSIYLWHWPYPRG